MNLYEERSAIQVRGNEAVRLEDRVCIEDTFRLYLNDALLVQIVASPGQLRELGAGFVVCEGLAHSVSDVRVSNNDVGVYASAIATTEHEFRSSGGIGFRGLTRTVSATLVIDRSEVARVIAHTESEAWRRTGGVHCSVLYQDGHVLVRSCDIGRHNTIDKVIGFALLNQVDLSRCVIGCTGRQPAGMIRKVANADVPIIISKAAATDAGIALAERSNVTLVCFARGEKFTIYTHPERIAGVVVT